MSIKYRVYTKNCAVSKVNKKFISHLTRAQPTPSAAATVQVSHALPAVRFSCLLWVQYPRWRRSRKRLSVCSVLRCPDLWLQCSVSFVHGLEKTHLPGASFLNSVYGAALKTTIHRKTRWRKPYAATQYLMLLMMGVCTGNMSSLEHINKIPCCIKLAFEVI